MSPTCPCSPLVSPTHPTLELTGQTLGRQWSRYPRIYCHRSSHIEIKTVTGPGSRRTCFCWKYICPAQWQPRHFRTQSPGALRSFPQPQGLRARLLWAADSHSVSRTMRSQRCHCGTRLLVPCCPYMGSAFPDDDTWQAPHGSRWGCGQAVELPTVSLFPLLNAAAPKRQRCRPGWRMQAEVAPRIWGAWMCEQRGGQVHPWVRGS